MCNKILKIKGLGKCYRNYGSEWRRVLSWFNTGVKPTHENWILKDIDFELEKGEAIGIVGHNGAGKSTLLKVIAGALKASEGSVELDGKVAAILELGMGFHPDFTGRENAFYAAGMMGYSKEEVLAVIDEIEKFAEIGSYFDQPVRIYSSGMHVRVAFAVATAFTPDVLIIDEALSVGDAYFQHKSFSRIREFLDKGTALIIVSHDSSAIMSLCDRALLFENGRLLASGDPENIINIYSARTAEREEDENIDASSLVTKKQIRSGNGKATIKCWELSCQKTGLPSDTYQVGDGIVLKVECKVSGFQSELGLGFMIRDRYGLPVYGTNSFLQKSQAKSISDGQSLVFETRLTLDIGKGQYSITLALENEQRQRLDWIDLAVVFEVSHRDAETFVGTAFLQSKMSVCLGQSD